MARKIGTSLDFENARMTPPTYAASQAMKRHDEGVPVNEEFRIPENEVAQKLSGLQPALLALGHGHPIAGDQVPGQLARLAANFDSIARPHHERHSAGREAAA